LITAFAIVSPLFSFETALALFSKRLLETGILHAHLSIDPLQAVVLFSYRSDLRHHAGIRRPKF
ncbi:MAG: hypothetical protein P8Q92_18470, partial [Pseudoprimorskyibacter sp.]|nr:hypothetical protein [Pseudoprimorskyibacter sp.]